MCLFFEITAPVSCYFFSFQQMGFCISDIVLPSFRPRIFAVPNHTRIWCTRGIQPLSSALYCNLQLVCAVWCVCYHNLLTYVFLLFLYIQHIIPYAINTANPAPISTVTMYVNTSVIFIISPPEYCKFGVFTGYILLLPFAPVTFVTLTFTEHTVTFLLTFTEFF